MNYFNRKYINNLATILLNKEAKKKYNKKDRNISLIKNNNKNMNKSMFDLLYYIDCYLLVPKNIIKINI